MPITAPMLNPARRPMRRISSEAGNVAIITPICCRPSGQVAKALSSASSCPTSEETVIMMVMLVIDMAWQRARTRTLRR